MSAELAGQVQQGHPFGRLGPRRLVTLPLSRVRPVIRIAHRVCQPLNIAERIIFDHELVLILHGEGELVFGHDRCLFSAHHLLFIPPFLPHRFADSGKQAGEHIAIHFDFAPDLPDILGSGASRLPYEVRLAHGLSLPRRLFVPAGQRLEQALREVVRAQASPAPVSSLSAVSSLMEVFALTLRPGAEMPAAAQGAPSSARVERVIALIHSRLEEPLTAKEMAEAAGISVSRLNTVFRQVTGRSPFDYLRHARVEAARRLLADPTLSVKEIAARTGFADSLHFSKVFRRVDGLPPTHYRAALLAYEAGPEELEPEEIKQAASP